MIGLDRFRQVLLLEHREVAARRWLEVDEVAHARGEALQQLMSKLLARLGRGRDELAEAAKFAR